MAYKGIHGHDDDTIIQVFTKNLMCNDSNAKQCRGEITSETPAITQAANIRELVYYSCNSLFYICSNKYIENTYYKYIFWTVAAGCSVEISDMLTRLHAEQKEKQNQIERLQKIKQLAENVCSPVKTGILLTILPQISLCHT